ncbi:hypothetical protein [Gloeobacter kilaueensis]|uniref:Phosphoribosylglycinamide formyltransferase 2 n=1 Tax=Gloeobacter kilaueensis (strain ATCC BAA-2537 / CCAP 1431/1 / ULC 316 / JS1) TaxID=1183438 RepID=U5QSA1_GLOK1|nr:hypothetical protein [Gloeobacter kilaueensis]AGY60590.1 phosphoribosylglycinamide formyltransferase 2 [Gloeobacter kilaueensis JS1]
MKLPPLWVAGPLPLATALADSYRLWGGEATIAADPTGIKETERLLWLAPPETDGGFPDLSGWQQAAASAPARLPVALSNPQAAERFCLPLVVTARGILYGEAIGIAADHFWQPFSLSDKERQQLYPFARSLVVQSPPGVSLVYFKIESAAVRFEKWLPFPDWPALATLGTQEPDLFACHWRCVLGLPIVDLQIHRPTFTALLSEWPAHLLRQAALLPESRLYHFARMVQVQAPTVQRAHEQLRRLLATEPAFSL